jgi:putative membrane protein
VYHLFSPGPARYTGEWRALYLFVLATHVVLAAVILPAAMNTWIRGWTGAITSHRALARPTLAAWIYVSVTGILVTWMAHG